MCKAGKKGGKKIEPRNTPNTRTGGRAVAELWRVAKDGGWCGETFNIRHSTLNPEVGSARGPKFGLRKTRDRAGRGVRRMIFFNVDGALVSLRADSGGVGDFLAVGSS